MSDHKVNIGKKESQTIQGGGKGSRVKKEKVIPDYEITDIPCDFCSNSFSSKVGVKVRAAILGKGSINYRLQING